MTNKSVGATPKSPRKRRKTRPPPVAMGLFDVEPPESVPVALGPPKPESAGELAGPAEGGGPVQRGLVAVAEVRAFEIAHLVRLGAISLHCAFEGARFLITTSRDAYARAREKNIPTFVGGELLAIAHAAQNDRMFAIHFRDVLRRKTENDSWRLTPRQALGIIFDAEPLTWSAGQVLDRVGAQLERVESHEGG